MPRRSRWTTLALLGVGTFWATYAALLQARGAPRQAAPGPPRGATRLGPARGGDPAAHRPDPRAQLDAELRNPRSPIQASTQFLRYDVTGGPAGARVAARVGLMERNPAARYVWALKVVDEADHSRVRLDHPYLDQVFTVAAGRLDPTFDEAIPLPPGRYRVILTLYQFHPSVRLDRMFAGNNPDLPGQAVIHNGKTVSVGG
jgi:hypothetical protein